MVWGAIFLNVGDRLNLATKSFQSIGGYMIGLLTDGLGGGGDLKYCPCCWFLWPERVGINKTMIWSNCIN